MCSKLGYRWRRGEEWDELESSLFMYCGNSVYTGIVLLSSRTVLSHDFFCYLLEPSMSHLVLLNKES